MDSTSQSPAPVPLLLPPRKHFWNAKFLVTLAILILAAADGYSYILQTQSDTALQEAVPTFTPRADTTAGWKTYTDTKYGYELKYPPGWFLSTYGSSIVLSGTNVVGGDPPTLSVTSLEQYNKPRLEDIYNGVIQNKTDFKKDCTAINFAGSSAYNCPTSSDSLYPGKPGIFFYKNSTPYNGFPFVIYDFIDNEISHQILSTFKFTDSSTTQTYENQYMKVTIPAGWIATQANGTFYGGNCTNKTNCVATQKVEPNPTAVNITKGNYLLSVNTQAGQASGIQGGRFNEIDGDAISAGAVILDPSTSGYCGTTETHSATANTLRNDLFVGPGDNKNMPWCNIPANGKTVWYFSYVAPASDGYFNYYKNQSSTVSGYTITMSYNSNNVNNLPVKGSTDLNAMLNEMTGIVQSLQVKQQ